MRRVLVAAAALLVTAVLVAPANAERTIAIEPQSMTVAPGSTFDLAISIDDAAGLAALQFDLAYANSLLSVSSLPTEGNLLSGRGWITTSNQLAPGVLRVVCYHPAAVEIASGSGILLQLGLSAAPSASGSTPLSLEGLLLSDGHGQEIASSAAGATVSFGQCTLALEATGDGSGSVVVNESVIHPEDLPWQGTFAPGTSITLRADASAGSQFTGWGGDVISAENPVSFDIEADMTIAVGFTLCAALVADAGPDRTIPAGGSATLLGSASGGSLPYSYSWSPSSGLSDASAAQPTASPPVTTTYTLTVTDSLAQTDTDAVTVVVVVPPVAEFSAAPAIGFAPLSVTFTDASTSSPLAWAWDLGDGATSTDQNPTHQYLEAGTYTVALTVTNDGGSDTQTKAHCILVTFPDVPFEPEEHWALRQILACVDAGVVQGYGDGTYHPTEVVNRAQMAVYISRALAGGETGVPATPPATSFPDDVPNTHWAYKYVEYTVDAGVVQGYDDTHYGPDVTVTRDQMAVFVARAKQWVNLGEALNTAPELFSDVPAGFWSGVAVQACVAHGVVNGYTDGTYHPEGQVTRDQMAVYVARAFALPM